MDLPFQVNFWGFFQIFSEAFLGRKITARKRLLPISECNYLGVGSWDGELVARGSEYQVVVKNVYDAARQQAVLDLSKAATLQGADDEDEEEAGQARKVYFPFSRDMML